MKGWQKKGFALSSTPCVSGKKSFPEIPSRLGHMPTSSLTKSSRAAFFSWHRTNLHSLRLGAFTPKVEAVLARNNE